MKKFKDIMLETKEPKETNESSDKCNFEKFKKEIKAYIHDYDFEGAVIVNRETEESLEVLDYEFKNKKIIVYCCNEFGDDKKINWCDGDWEFDYEM